MTREELENQSKDTLITWLLNSEYERIKLMKRLDKLTGCSDFGTCDSTNGSCVICGYEQPELYERCWNFRFDKNKNL